MNAAAATFSVNEIGKYIRSKADLYEAAVRNGYFLPQKNAQVVTEEFITDVLRGSCWCPKFSEIRLLPCPRPPSKETLLKKFAKMVKEKAFKNVTIDEKHQPDCKWLLDVLSTFAPHDEIFNKNYVGPSHRQRQQDIKSVELPAAVLIDLPLSTKRVKARRLKLLGKGMVESKINHLKHAQKQVGIALLEQQINLERFSKRSHLKEEKKYPIVTAGADPLKDDGDGQQQPVQSKPQVSSPRQGPSTGKQAKAQGQVSTPMPPQNPQSRNASATRTSGCQEGMIVDQTGNR